MNRRGSSDIDLMEIFVSISKFHASYKSLRPGEHLWFVVVANAKEIPLHLTLEYTAAKSSADMQSN
jgi:hypothetical protein